MVTASEVYDQRVSVSITERKTTLSPTALDHAQICGRRLQYYLDPDTPRGTYGLTLAQGRAWHWMMEQFNRFRLWAQVTHPKVTDVLALMDTTDPELPWFERLYMLGVGYMAEEVNQPDFAWEEGDDWDQAKSELRAMLFSWASRPGHMWLGDGVQVVTAEARVLTEMGSPWHQMNGYIDAVMARTYQPEPLLHRYPDLPNEAVETILVDYKSTGKRWGKDKGIVSGADGRLYGDPRKLIQAPLYAEGWERSTGEVVDWVVYDIMTRKGAFQRVWVNVKAARRQLFIERWVAVSEMAHRYQELGEDLPVNPGHFMCSEKWCPFWTVCPVGAPYESETT